MCVLKSGEYKLQVGVSLTRFLSDCKMLLKNIDFNDSSHIYPFKILFLCYSFFWLITPYIKSQPMHLKTIPFLYIDLSC